MFLSTPMTSVSDRERLLGVLDNALSSWVTYAPYLESFRGKLRRSRPVSIEEVPGDVITMNSRFVLHDRRDDQTHIYTLVYPEDGALQDGKISVLSPMGMALHGAKVGDEVCWLSTVGPEVATVTRLLYQPEAAGHRHR